MIKSSLTVLLLVGSAYAAPLPDPVKETEVPKELLKARLDAVREVFRIAKAEADAGKLSEDGPSVWSVRLLEAERALATTRDEHLAACRQHVERMRDFEKVQKARLELGRISPKDYAAAKYFLAEAEILRARVEGKK